MELRLHAHYNTEILELQQNRKRERHRRSLSKIVYKLAVDIVVSVHLVDSLKHLVQINKGSDKDERADNIPQPEISSAEAVGDAASFQFVADSVGNSVIPNNTGNTKGQRNNDKYQQAEVHSLFAVVSGGDDVDIAGDGRHYHQRINAESDNRQQNCLQQTLVCFQLLSRCRVNCVFHIDSPFFFFCCIIICNFILMRILRNVNKI